MDSHQTSLALCPACGYDLRAANDNRCSECGAAYNPADLPKSWMPWERAKGVGGKLKAIFATVWMMSIKPGRLVLEEQRTHVYSASRWFRIILSVFYILSAAVVLGYVWQMKNINLVDRAIVRINNVIDDTSGTKFSAMDKWIMQFELILGFGLKGKWMVWIVLGMVGLELSLWPRRLAWFHKAPEEQRPHLKALGNYLSAPLTGVCVCGWAWYGLSVWAGHASPAMKILLKYFQYGVLSAGGLLVALFLLNALRWRMRIKGIGVFRGTVEIGLWMGDLAGRAFLWLVMVPIYVGYVRMIWEG